MKHERTHPALFHRVFLSHLLTVLVCFVAAIILIDYLFVANTHLYLLRNPIILIPALMAIVGISGLLALWSAGGGAVPLGRLTELFNQRAAADEFLRLRDEAGIEENAELIDAIHAYLKRQAGAAPRPLTFTLDERLNILHTDADTAARLGYTAADLQRRNMRVLLESAEDRAMLQDVMQLARRAQSPDIFTLRLRAVGDRVMTVEGLMFLVDGGDTFLFVGWEVRRGT